MPNGRVRELRWTILIVLRAADESRPGEFADVHLIQAALDDQGKAMTTDEIEGELLYLADKSCIELRRAHVGKTRFVTARIRATGRDVLDETVRMPGIGAASVGR